MNVLNKSDYYNAFYKAIIIDDNTSDDPDGEERYQIYIPKLHYEYSDRYQAYMNNSAKQSDPLFFVFPWATSLFKNLKNGDEVFIGNIDNENGNYLVLTTKGTATSSGSSSSSSSDSSNKTVVKEVYGNNKEFIEKVADAARKNWNPFHIFPSTVIAQAILESGWGKSYYARERNNLFGINAVDKDPDRAFTYASFAEGIRGYYIHTYWSGASSGYKAVIQATDWESQIDAVGKSGYASDPQYASKLKNLVNSYALYKYNEGLTPFTPDITMIGKYKM